MFRRVPRLFLEESAEGRGVGERQVVGNLLNGLARRVDEEDASPDDGFEDELLHGISADRLHEGGEIFRRETEFVGIERHLAFVLEVLADEGDELPEYLCCPCRNLRPVGYVRREEVAEAVGEADEQQLPLVVPVG